MRIRYRYANFQKVLLKFYLPMRSPCKYKQGSLHMRIRVIFMHIGAKLPIRAKINQCHYGESRLFVTGRPKYALTFRAG